MYGGCVNDVVTAVQYLIVKSNQGKIIAMTGRVPVSRCQSDMIQCISNVKRDTEFGVNSLTMNTVSGRKEYRIEL